MINICPSCHAAMCDITVREFNHRCQNHSNCLILAHTRVIDRSFLAPSGAMVDGYCIAKYFTLHPVRFADPDSATNSVVCAIVKKCTPFLNCCRVHIHMLDSAVTQTCIFNSRPTDLVCDELFESFGRLSTAQPWHEDCKGFVFRFHYVNETGVPRILVTNNDSSTQPLIVSASDVQLSPQAQFFCKQVYRWFRSDEPYVGASSLLIALLFLEDVVSFRKLLNYLRHNNIPQTFSINQYDTYNSRIFERFLLCERFESTFMEYVIGCTHYLDTDSHLYNVWSQICGTNLALTAISASPESLPLRVVAKCNPIYNYTQIADSRAISWSRKVCPDIQQRKTSYFLQLARTAALLKSRLLRVRKKKIRQLHESYRPGGPGYQRLVNENRGKFAAFGYKRMTFLGMVDLYRAQRRRFAAQLKRKSLKFFLRSHRFTKKRKHFHVA